MTFDPSVPNAAQSPGLFPPQNSANFAQLKKIIIADHVFNDTAQATDGFHKQVTLIPRLTPGGADAILYDKVETDASIQLHFWNGANDYQLTPPQELYPIRIVGSASLTAGSTAVAYADPGFRWAGTGWAIQQGAGNRFTFYNLLRSGGNNAKAINFEGSTAPTLLFNTIAPFNDLLIKNNSASTAVYVWSLIINRIV